MRQAIGFPSLFLAVTLLASAQQPATRLVLKPVSRSAAPRAEAATTSTQLPVTRVALYKNGVGFFEHTGHITGNQSVTIDFTTAQLNDVLQSLTAIDLNGGRIAGAGYNSTTPLEQQLKALPLALGEDPTAVDFYNAIRGARVEVRSGAVTITGRLLNIEVVNVPEGDNKPASEKRIITVIGDAGDIRSIELTSTTSVRLLDADLHTDVTRYLQLLASTRNQGLRHLTLQDNGTGTRELHVSYISEVPIWKSTYRILFTEQARHSVSCDPVITDSAKTTSVQASVTCHQADSMPELEGKRTATLQGWSVVDNTTGTDWNDVQLSLIAGAPQSFIQPLSVPYYSRRPEIGLPQEAQLTPQTHESGDIADTFAGGLHAPTKIPRDIKMVKDDGPPPAAAAGMAGVAGMGVGVAGGMAGMGSGNGSGLGAGSGGNYGGGVRRIGNGAPAAPYEQSAEESIVANATAAKFDDYFAYNLTEPITIRKNESALVPILQTKIDAERVTLWSPQQPTPLRALWITNTSNLTLDRGSFSIVEDGNFGGEGLLDPIHPAEKRLLSYAVDQAVRVTTDYSHNTDRIVSISVSKGILKQSTLNVSEVEYLIHNAADEPRSVVIEHPVRAGWTLDSDPKPSETTPTVNRFRVNTAPRETVRLHIGERHSGTATYQLTNFNDNQLTYILNQTNNNPAIAQAFQPILESRRRLADIQAALDRVNARLTALRSDEERQRSNITALATADKGSRDRFVHDLNTTEDELAAAQKDQSAAQANVQAAKDDLSNKIAALQIDQKL